MGILDFDFSSASLEGIGLSIISTLFTIVMVGAFITFAGIILYILFKFLAYSVDIELWERKGEALVYAGDDRARRVNKKGVTYISFLKNRGAMFKHRQFPGAEYVYRKKLFGSKLKFLIVGDELLPMTVKLGNPQGLVAASMPTYQKIDYLQRMDNYQKEFENKDMNMQKTALIIGVTFAGIILFGFFIIWQSNVATAEATKALAGAVQAGAAATANSIPAAVG